MITEIGIDINKAAKLLMDDELVSIPTETVYGLAGNALSDKAVAKIYAAKKRPSFNPLILHVCNIDQIELYADIDLHSMILAKVLMCQCCILLSNCCFFAVYVMRFKNQPIKRAFFTEGV